MSDDLISRKAAKNKKVYSKERHEYVIPVAEIDWLPSAQLDYDLSGYSAKLWKAAYERGKAEAQLEQQWIPVKIRPMTEEERQYYSEMYGYDVEYEEAVMFDCRMPEYGQEVWVCSKCGNVWQDTCVVDEGIGLEENGDWLDIAAWMPFEKPKPYERRKDENNNQI